MTGVYPIIKHILHRTRKKPVSLIFFLLTTLVLAPIFLYWLLAYRLANDPRLVPHEFRHAKNILFVTAHPDDESLFFSPSVLYRRDDPTVARGLLVLSAGDYAGIGQIRRAELQRSCAQSDIIAKRCVSLDHEKLQDDPRQWWREDIIREIVGSYIRRWNVDLIITFDSGGVSGHINHRAVSAAIADYVKHDPKSPLVYVVQTKFLLRKYSGLVDLVPTSIPFTWRIIKAVLTSPPIESLVDNGKGATKQKDPYSDKALLVNDWSAYMQARNAFSQHQSQYLWDRVLYLMINRYMWYNDLRRLRE